MPCHLIFNRWQGIPLFFVLPKKQGKLEGGRCMRNNTRIIDKFEHWSVADCDCSQCVHYAGKDNPCPLDVCCIADIKAEAIQREVEAENRLAVASVRGREAYAVD